MPLQRQWTWHQPLLRRIPDCWSTPKSNRWESKDFWVSSPIVAFLVAIRNDFIVIFPIFCQVNCFPPFSNRSHGASCTHCSKCSRTACITFSHSIAYNCCPICIHWLRCRTQIKPNCIYALNRPHYVWSPAWDQLRYSHNCRGISPSRKLPAPWFRLKVKNWIKRWFWLLLGQCTLRAPVNFPSTPRPIHGFQLNDLVLIHLAGMDDQSNSWCKDLLSTIMQNTPHSWDPHTLQCFPPIMNTYLSLSNVPKENKQMLKKSVDEEYRNWMSMTNENDIIAHFSVQGTAPLFLCLLFKMILETNAITPVAYK